MVFNDVEAFRTLDALQLTVLPGITMATPAAKTNTQMKMTQSFPTISTSWG
jgi:hypothetical protein